MNGRSLFSVIEDRGEPREWKLPFGDKTVSAQSDTIANPITRIRGKIAFAVLNLRNFDQPSAPGGIWGTLAVLKSWLPRSTLILAQLHINRWIVATLAAAFHVSPASNLQTDICGFFFGSITHV